MNSSVESVSVCFASGYLKDIEWMVFIQRRHVASKYITKSKVQMLPTIIEHFRYLLDIRGRIYSWKTVQMARVNIVLYNIDKGS